jgi:hypothetical protein
VVTAPLPVLERLPSVSITARRWLLGCDPWTDDDDVVHHSAIVRWEHLVIGHGASGLDARLAAFWREHEQIVVAWHVRHWPGTRPLRWWEYSSPEPRKRLGGRGTPLHECTAYGLSLHYGIPDGWRRHGDYFTAGTPIDPADPPRYESEAKYLLRLGLLLPGERERLCPRDFWPELVEP